MEQHLLIHSLMLGVSSGGGRTPALNTAKDEKIPRPQIRDEGTDSDWSFFLYRWSEYKENSGLAGQQVTDQLRHCASVETQRKVFEGGCDRNAAEEDLLKALKKLCVRAQNRLVNIVEFGTILQSQDEPVAAVLSRLKGAALNCNFKVKCPFEKCGKDVNYSEEMIAHQLVKGLVDPVIHEEVLSKGADNQDMSLKAIVRVVEAKEQSKRSQGLLVTGTAAGMRKTEYAAKQLSKKVENQDQVPFKKCYNCGYKEHGLSPEDKKKNCKAVNATCNSCKKKLHFSSVCKSKKA